MCFSVNIESWNKNKYIYWRVKECWLRKNSYEVKKHLWKLQRSKIHRLPRCCGSGSETFSRIPGKIIPEPESGRSVEFEVKLLWKLDKIWQFPNTNTQLKNAYSFIYIKMSTTKHTYKPRTLRTVLGIHDILGWIRIRIRGSVPLTSGSGFGSGFGSGSWIWTLLFSSLPFKMPAKTNFLTQYFLIITFWSYIYTIFKR